MLPLLAVLFSGPVTMAATAAGAASVPVIIHLLNRRRFRIVNWAAMRFLLAAQKKNARKLRIEQVLLLLLRMLLLILLVVAMASVTPWGDRFWSKTLPESFATSTPAGRRTHRIILIDGSFSMSATSGDSSSFERARQLAQGIIQKGQSGDGISVILMAGTVRPVVPEVLSEVSDDKEYALSELGALQLPHGNSDLEGAVEALTKLLEKSPSKFVQKEVYFLTDLRESTWNLPQSGHLQTAFEKIREQARTIVVDVGQEMTHNLAVTQIQLKEDLALAGQSSRVEVQVRAFGTKLPAETGVALFLGKASDQVDGKPPQLEEYQKTTLKNLRAEHNSATFLVTFPEEGKYVLEARLPADSLPVDDRRRIVLDVRKEINVLLVNGHPQPVDPRNPHKQSTGKLASAIAPHEGPQNRRPDGQLPIRTTTLTASEFLDAGKGDLTKYDCVFLCDVPFLSSKQRTRLETHLKQRGGLVVFLGPHVQINSYNELFRRDGTGVLPAELLGISPPATTSPYTLTFDTTATNQPPLTGFRRQSEQAALKSAPFTRYYKVNPIRPPDTRYKAPRTSLSFRSGKSGSTTGPSTEFPALIYWQPVLSSEEEEGEEGSNRLQQTQRGWVFMITSSANRDWSDWPARPTFIASMQEVLRHALSPRLKEQTYVVGQVLEQYLPGQGEKPVRLYPPTKLEPEQFPTLIREDFALLRWVSTDESGTYRARVGKDNVVHLFAVNAPNSYLDEKRTESNPRRTTTQKLKEQYREWDHQVVTDPGKAQHKTGGGSSTQTTGMGRTLAHWLLLVVLGMLVLEVILAFVFGHYSAVHERAVGGGMMEPSFVRWVRVGVICSLVMIIVLLAGLGFVIVHDQITGEFLGFLPDQLRTRIAGWHSVDVPEPAAGESSHWNLSFDPYLHTSETDPWIVGGLALAIGVLVVVIYSFEKKIAAGGTVTEESVEATKPSRQPFWYFLLFCGLRLTLILLMLGVLLPQMRVQFKQKSWPDLVILIDDSQSMSVARDYHDPKVQELADKIAERALPSDREKQLRAQLASAKPTDRPRLEAELKQRTVSERLRVAQALLASQEADWITRLLNERHFRVRVYHCSGRARPVGSVITTAEDIPATKQAIANLAATKENRFSRLGDSLRQVIDGSGGRSLAAVVMLTDGVRNEGDKLPEVAKYARKKKVPLYFIGIGDSHEKPDLHLSELEVADNVIVNDKLIFSFHLTAKGLGGEEGQLEIPIHLYETDREGKKLLGPNGRPKELETVHVKGANLKQGSTEVQLGYAPKEAGRKYYVIETPAMPEEVKTSNNRLGPREVMVLKQKLINVLYVEGYGRWEYRFLKRFLSQESDRPGKRKSLNLDVVLLQSAKEYAQQDPHALDLIPPKEALEKYDVIIIGDVCPDPALGKDEAPHVRKRLDLVPTFLQDVADLVKNQGRGLLMISGERYAPNTYSKTPLAEILPIQITKDQSESPSDKELETGFRPTLTPEGRLHPIFSFTERTAENEKIWNNLPKPYWYATGYRLGPDAEVLAVHPTRKAEGGPGQAQRDHPLIVHQFAGTGRCLFFGIHETWLWRFREYEPHYDRFWVQTMRYLARSKQRQIKLKVDKDIPYKRGEAIRLTARFPDDVPPPDKNAQVLVKMVRKATRSKETETRELKLLPRSDRHGTFEIVIPRTPEGKYVFELLRPKVKPPAPTPRAECLVEPPPSEMDPDQLRMNQEVMTEAATETGGKFYQLTDVARIITDLPEGERRTSSTSGDPWRIWNHPLIFLFVLLLLGSEWILRKRRHLL